MLYLIVVSLQARIKKIMQTDEEVGKVSAAGQSPYSSRIYYTSPHFCNGAPPYSSRVYYTSPHFCNGAPHYSPRIYYNSPHFCNGATLL